MLDPIVQAARTFGWPPALAVLPPLGLATHGPTYPLLLANKLLKAGVEAGARACVQLVVRDPAAPGRVTSVKGVKAALVLSEALGIPGLGHAVLRCCSSRLDLHDRLEMAECLGTWPACAPLVEGVVRDAREDVEEYLVPALRVCAKVRGGRGWVVVGICVDGGGDSVCGCVFCGWVGVCVGGGGEAGYVKWYVGKVGWLVQVIFMGGCGMALSLCVCIRFCVRGCLCVCVLVFVCFVCMCGWASMCVSISKHLPVFLRGCAQACFPECWWTVDDPKLRCQNAALRPLAAC